MSWHGWHTYGYGVKISELGEISMSKVVELVQTAPNFAKDFNKWLSDCEIKEPTLEDLEEFDTYHCLGLVTVLKEIIFEVEKIELIRYQNRMMVEWGDPMDHLIRMPVNAKELLCRQRQKILSVKVRIIHNES